MLYSLKEIATGKIIRIYERPFHPWLFGNEWDDKSKFEKKPYTKSKQEVTSEKIIEIRSHQVELLVQANARAVDEGRKSRLSQVNKLAEIDAYADELVNLLDNVESGGALNSLTKEQIKNYSVIWPISPA